MGGVYGRFKRTACIVVESSGRSNLRAPRLHSLRNNCVIVFSYFVNYGFPSPIGIP